MLRGIALLLLFQLAGEVISRLLHLPVPGPVIGMLLLFAVLAWRGRSGADLDGAAHGLLRHLSLLFVPAGVGVVQYLQALRADGLAIVAAVAISTVLAMTVTALCLQALLRRGGGSAR